MAAPVVISRTPTLEHRSPHHSQHTTPRKVDSPACNGNGNGNASNGLPKLDLSSTPNGKHLLSTTPGGSRIVYSLEELLSLASSPLSRMSAMDVPVPDEISRSPEKQRTASMGHDSGFAMDAPNVMQSAAYTAQAASPPTSKAAAAATTPRAFGRLSFSHRSPAAAGILSTSPTTSRSPGNAFNFARGPMGGLGNSAAVSGTPSNAPPALESTPAEFKERLAAASAAAREQQRNMTSAVAGPTSNTGNKESDVQFDMDM